MKKKRFSNPPLVEAIFELRWKLKEVGSGIKVDPHYKLLIGSLFSKLKEKYPFHEPLPASTMPDEISCYVIQHRFRTGKEQWPLVQIGPGIVTLNATNEYGWIDFRDRVFDLLKNLFDIYPDKESFSVNNILMRYINAIEFDYISNSIFNFLSKKMKIDMFINKSLFKNENINKQPSSFDLKYVFEVSKPIGNIHLRLARGKKDDINGLIFEFFFQTQNKYVPNRTGEILDWVSQSHDLIEDWFLKLTKGDLKRSFK